MLDQSGAFVAAMDRKSAERLVDFGRADVIGKPDARPLRIKLREVRQCTPAENRPTSGCHAGSIQTSATLTAHDAELLAEMQQLQKEADRLIAQEIDSGWHSTPETAAARARIRRRLEATAAGRSRLEQLNNGERRNLCIAYAADDE
jgi:hypothetical protein